VKPGDTNKADKTKATLTDKIAFELNDQLAKHVNAKRLWRVGLHLDDWHRESLNLYIKSKTEEGIGATLAIQNFCNEFDIELDIDVSFETLYKDWQRFAKRKTNKNTAFFRRKKSVFVLKNGEKMTKHLRVKNLFSDSELDGIIEKYVADNPAEFKTIRQLPRKKLLSQLSLYVYRAIGDRTPQYICSKFKLRRTFFDKDTNRKKTVADDRSLRYAVRSFSIYLKTAPPIVLPDATA
jgi:hypothetical protein